MEYLWDGWTSTVFYWCWKGRLLSQGFAYKDHTGKRFSDLDEADRQLIILRAGLQLFQRVCWDPFRDHKKPVRGSLRSISMMFSEECGGMQLDFIPGKKLCWNCRKVINEKFQSSVSEDEPEESEIDEDISVLEKSLPEETERNDLSQCLSKLCVSPIKAHARP